ncbi:hypothetical protein OV090_42085 [Nannocystis sp. RBIL2]|uniref:hypothetical protein n=1 Tax=Nannocystis sp. RBIL2 TaxID=2996788 RepID=UPI00226FCCE5|nr:hypothetical protein [Nannocystis sp. RBIL2]MCY1071408.1 hypothetical protein [Nannocystis sp. RBIL2]
MTLRYSIHLNKAALTAGAVAALDFTPAPLKHPAKRTNFTLAPPSGTPLATSGNAARN